MPHSSCQLFNYSDSKLPQSPHEITQNHTYTHYTQSVLAADISLYLLFFYLTWPFFSSCIVFSALALFFSLLLTSHILLSPLLLFLSSLLTSSLLLSSLLLSSLLLSSLLNSYPPLCFQMCCMFVLLCSALLIGVAMWHIHCANAAFCQKLSQLSINRSNTQSL